VTRAARRGLRATPGSDFFQTGSLRRSRILFPLEAPTSGKTYSSNRFEIPFHQAEDFEVLRPAKSLPAGIGFGGDVRVKERPRLWLQSGTAKVGFGPGGELCI
jgi:hypothetical protein